MKGISPDHDMTIGVVIPHYNQGEYLGEAVQSALNQNLSPSEIIIVDDGSAKKHLQAAHKLESDHSVVRLIEHKSNKGAIAAQNTGLLAARSDFILFRAADDISLPDSFEAAYAILCRNPDAHICCGDTTYFGESVEEGRTEQLRFSERPSYLSPDELTARLGAETLIHGASTFVRRQTITEMGGLSKEFLWYADWFAFHSIAFKYGICYCPIPLSGFRLRSSSYGNSGIANKSRNTKILKNLQRAIEKSDPLIADRFRASGVLEMFGRDFTAKVGSSARAQNFLMPEKERNGTATNKIDLSRGMGESIFQALSSHIKLMRSHLAPSASKCMVFGAGRHSEILITAWRRLNLPEIDAVLLSSPVERKSFLGIPTQSIEETKAGPNDLIILSSKSFEEEMANICTERFPQTPRLAVWASERTFLPR